MILNFLYFSFFDNYVYSNQISYLSMLALFNYHQSVLNHLLYFHFRYFSNSYSKPLDFLFHHSIFQLVKIIHCSFHIILFFHKVIHGLDCQTFIIHYGIADHPNYLSFFNNFQFTQTLTHFKLLIQKIDFYAQALLFCRNNSLFYPINYSQFLHYS